MAVEPPIRDSMAEDVHGAPLVAPDWQELETLYMDQFNTRLHLEIDPEEEQVTRLGPTSLKNK